MEQPAVSRASKWPMYREYFGLKETPFSISPDPHYFYISEGHREALAHLMYGIRIDGGFVLLTGEVGTGKTMICRCLLEQVPENCEIAFILNPKVSSLEFLAAICDEFGVPYPEGTGSIKELVDRLSDFLLGVHEKRRRAILIIEEAQNLTVEVLEQVRLLTNLETSKRKLLQIIMLGQPELREMLAKPELRQLSQRITARYHLGPLSKKEIPSYVGHRLSVAGWARGELFPRPVTKTLCRLTGGVPRLLNIVCDRALLGTYIEGKDRIDKQTLVRAAREVSGKKIDAGKQTRKVCFWALTAFLLNVSIAGGVLHHMQKPVLDPRGPSKAGRTVEMGIVASAEGQAARETLFVRIRDRVYRVLSGVWRTSPNPAPACERTQAGDARYLDGRGDRNVVTRLDDQLTLSGDSQAPRDPEGGR